MHRLWIHSDILENSTYNQKIPQNLFSRSAQSTKVFGIFRKILILGVRSPCCRVKWFCFLRPLFFKVHMHLFCVPLFKVHNGSHFLCWISEIVSFNTWVISSWQENKCCFKLSKYIHKMTSMSLKLVEAVILSGNSCHFVCYSACNKSLR